MYRREKIHHPTRQILRKVSERRFARSRFHTAQPEPDRPSHANSRVKRLTPVGLRSFVGDSGLIGHMPDEWLRVVTSVEPLGGCCFCPYRDSAPRHVSRCRLLLGGRLAWHKRHDGQSEARMVKEMRGYGMIRQHLLPELLDSPLLNRAGYR